jgi:polyferredoxin
VVSKIDMVMRDNWAVISEAGGGGIAGAAERNLAASSTPLWKQPAFAISVLIMPLIYFTAIWTLIDKSSTAEIKTMVVSLVVGGTLGAIVGFFLGSSFTTSKSRGLGASPSSEQR